MKIVSVNFRGWDKNQRRWWTLTVLGMTRHDESIPYEDKKHVLYQLVEVEPDLSDWESAVAPHLTPADGGTYLWIDASVGEFWTDANTQEALIQGQVTVRTINTGALGCPAKRYKFAA